MEESSSREKVLKKIRNALIHKATKERPAFVDFETEVFYKAEEESELIFAQNFTESGGKFIFCEDNVILVENIEFVVTENGCNQGLVCQESMLQGLLQIAEIPYNNQYTADSTIVVCSCEYLISRTGSILISSKQGTQKAAFLNAPILVVIAFTNQLVDNMRDALIEVRKKYQGVFPNMLSMITNPNYQETSEKQQEIYVLLINSKD